LNAAKTGQHGLIVVGWIVDDEVQLNLGAAWKVAGFDLTQFALDSA
jgi:hypothetical protein